ncbi:MAG TPA: DNA double-strand break repair nuclease NurA [Acidimicrobiales bacterium]|nr:DNA double-strand break repair nuclease NurA [Acidimicrobiales bacterium]
MTTIPLEAPDTVEAAASRLATLLTGSGTTMSDAGGSGDLQFEPVLSLRSLVRTVAPAEAWAVDGGQITVADARCISVLATRAARVRFRNGRCDLEDEGAVRVMVLGTGENAAARAALALDVLAADASVDGNLVRDRWEWDGVLRCIDEAEPGAIVLIDGDLQPDWRIPSTFLAALLESASARGVVLAAITKHSSLARGGAPLLGQLELEAAALYGSRAMWWSAIGRVRGDVGPGIQVVAARLDPDARFAFRVDLPGDVDPEPVLGAISALCDDAAFPGYPYPLTVADRLAACPGWLAAEVRMQLDDHLDRAGVPLEVRERAFADRHSLMERA